MCDTLFTTNEAIDYRKIIMVTYSAGQPQPLNRDRLFVSVYKTFGHRPTALTDASGLTATIIAKLPAGADGKLRIEQITQTALVALNRFDTLAAQLYAATHKS